MITISTAPDLTPPPEGSITVFLAGTIDMGESHNWQKAFPEDLAPLIHRPVHLFNPRRVQWDATWNQSDNPLLAQQIQWELDHLEISHLRIFNIEENSKSPVTLMELGLHANTGGRNLVRLPEDFWRYSNVVMMCRKYGIPYVSKYEDLIVRTAEMVNRVPLGITP